MVKFEAIAMDRPCEVLAPAASATRMTKFDVPFTVGVPEITPVEELIVRPGGSEPDRFK
jgi:hypothetical protein